MTHQKNKTGCRCRGKKQPDMEETKAHVLAAGREILLAAGGALRFCKSYVEKSAESKSSPHLVGFFQKAITVADDLGKSILDISPVQGAAKGIVKSLFESMEEEMQREQPRTGKKTRRKRTRKVNPKSRIQNPKQIRNPKSK